MAQVSEPLPSLSVWVLPLNEALSVRMADQVKIWRDELVNTTRSNRLLYYRPTRSSTLELSSPPPKSLLDRLAVNAGCRFFMPELDERGDTLNRPTAAEAVAEGTSSDVGKALKSLDKRSRQEFIDRGAWTLYLALGALQWFDPQDEKLVVSRLLLLPVSLEASGPSGAYVMRRNEGDTALNPALAIKLDNGFGLRLPTIDEVDDSSVASVVDAVAAAVASEPRWSVAERAVVSMFTFAKEAMYQDLLAHEAAIMTHPIVRALALGPDAPGGEAFGFEPLADDQLDTKASPESSLAVLDADSTQRRCVAAALAGKSFAMDGPPGTGKSQTSTNMVGELMEAGKSVLCVSEKAAALDIVRNRLAGAHLEPFVLELHSFMATRKAVASELGQASAERPRAASALARDQLATLQRDREALTAYAQALNEEREPLGPSLSWVLGRLGPALSSGLGLGGTLRCGVTAWRLGRVPRVLLALRLELLDLRRQASVLSLGGLQASLQRNHQTNQLGTGQVPERLGRQLRSGIGTSRDGSTSHGRSARCSKVYLIRPRRWWTLLNGHPPERDVRKPPAARPGASDSVGLIALTSEV